MAVSYAKEKGNGIKALYSLQNSGVSHSNVSHGWEADGPVTDASGAEADTGINLAP
jgi:hypothetical protein